jgi:hypothetical protein
VDMEVGQLEMRVEHQPQLCGGGCYLASTVLATTVLPF